MRAFDLLSKAEQEIRLAAHPRYYFEMVLLRWMHLRKLVPLSELMEQMGSSGAPRLAPPRVSAPVAAPAKPIAPAAKEAIAPPRSQPASPAKAAASPAKPIAPAKEPNGPASSQAVSAARSAVAPNVKDSLLGEIKAGKPFFYNTVVAQAQKIEVAGDRVTFVFSPTHRALREQFEQSRAWVETTAERVVGRRVMVESTQGAAVAGGAEGTGTKMEPSGASDKRDLKADAMGSSVIQAVLDVFPAEIRDVEEMEP
jgi:DNA polymerase III gamma/tau subunit